MPTYYLECNYCGNVWSEFIYSGRNSFKFTCPICKDSNIKFKKEKNIDYYSESVILEDAYIKKEDKDDN